MAGHQIFHDATVKFTEDFLSSLPRRLSEYSSLIQSTFKLTLNELDNEYTCTGPIKLLSVFMDEFPKHVSEEEKKAVNKLLSEENGGSYKRQKLQASIPMHCPACEFTSKDNIEYCKHIRRQHSKDELVYKCDQCKDKAFETKDLGIYVRHMRTVHLNVRTVLCELCGLSFKRTDAFKNHLLSVHGSGAVKRHECEICHKKFLRKAHLLDHYQVHSDRKELTCDLCPTKFKSEAAKQKHIFYQHTNPKSFKCDKCRKTFNTKQNLQKHMAIHERETSLDKGRNDQLIYEQIEEIIQADKKNKIVYQPETDSPDNAATGGKSAESARPTSVPSPAADIPVTCDPDTTTSNVHPVASVTLSSQIDDSTVMTQTPAYPSRPASVTPQYTSYNESPLQDNNEDKDLDEIFPQSAAGDAEEPEEQYVSKIPQEELDSVFRQDVVRPDPHTQLSRPGSVGSHHAESLPNADALDSLLHSYRPTVSAEGAVASPQSVCSSQFTHQSRPPSVASQHGSYHDPVSVPVPSFIQSQGYSLTSPQIVFSQPLQQQMPMSCTANISSMQPMADVYKPVSAEAPNQQTQHYMHDTQAEVDDHIIGSVASYNDQLQPTSFTDQYGTTPHYTSTSFAQECVTIQSTTRCVTPQNFPTTPTFRQQTADGRPEDMFTNLAVAAETLLLPPSGPNDVIPELRTPGKNFSDEFPNILPYSSPN